MDTMEVRVFANESDVEPVVEEQQPVVEEPEVPEAMHYGPEEQPRNNNRRIPPKRAR